jgi:hypothetical protein
MGREFYVEPTKFFWNSFISFYRARVGNVRELRHLLKEIMIALSIVFDPQLLKSFNQRSLNIFLVKKLFFWKSPVLEPECLFRIIRYFGGRA